MIPLSPESRLTSTMLNNPLEVFWLWRFRGEFNVCVWDEEHRESHDKGMRVLISASWWQRYYERAGCRFILYLSYFLEMDLFSFFSFYTFSWPVLLLVSFFSFLLTSRSFSSLSSDLLSFHYSSSSSFLPSFLLPFFLPSCCELPSLTSRAHLTP